MRVGQIRFEFGYLWTWKFFWKEKVADLKISGYDMPRQDQNKVNT